MMHCHCKISSQLVVACWSYANLQTTEGFTYVTPYW